jgi:phosphoheptose isomerase
LEAIFEKLITRCPDLEECLADIERASAVLAACYRGGGKLLVCGNGGSAADSEHIVGELMKGFNARRPVPGALREQLTQQFAQDGAYLADHLQGALPAISLVSQTALMTACANDLAGDMVYAQQVYGYGRPGDTLLAISTSGNARNVVHALQLGCTLGLHTIGLTGRHGGAMVGLAEILIRVPWDRTPDIQERHLAIYHAICARLETEFFAS